MSGSGPQDRVPCNSCGQPTLHRTLFAVSAKEPLFLSFLRSAWERLPGALRHQVEAVQ